MIRIGLVVNPIAGLGGSTGHKGSDGHWQDALDSGAEPHAQERAARVVAASPEATWLTVPGAMGVPGVQTIAYDETTFGDTDATDTAHAAKALIAAGIDLLCFAGGDGTATDIAAAVGDQIPCLGIPAGVKITSAVFAHSPEEAAWLIHQLTPGFPTVARDVTDLDEAAYRDGRVETHLMGALTVPLSPAVQGGKVATTLETPLEGLIEMALRDWDESALNLVGAGSVCRAIKQQFWGEPTLLGLDAIQGTKIIQNDLDATSLDALLATHDGAVHLWLTLIGGQGVVLGRGTQVLSPSAIRRIGWDNLHVVAPPEKLLGLKGIYVDTGDPELDAQAPKYIRIMSGWNETRMIRVIHPGDSPVAQ